jgi:hypothetical protein
MKALDESQRKRIARAGLILLFDGEVGLGASEAVDEHKQTGILTPNFEPHSRLPGIYPVAF